MLRSFVELQATKITLNSSKISLLLKNGQRFGNLTLKNICDEFGKNNPVSGVHLETIKET